MPASVIVSWTVLAPGGMLTRHEAEPGAGSAFVNVAGLSRPHGAASSEPDAIVPDGGVAPIIDPDPRNQNNFDPGRRSGG